MKIVKLILIGLIGLLLLSGVLLCFPRIWSALTPNRAPLGYFFETPTYVALYAGLEKMIEKEPLVPSAIQEIKNIEYKNIDSTSLQIDMYVPRNLTKPAPLLVFIHGGAWAHGKRSDYLTYLIPFAQQGYITATVSYRLVKDSINIYPACAEDISDAVKWFFQNGEKYGYDPDRIALIGGSAGGHLSLLGAYGWRQSTKEKPDSIPEIQHKIKAVVDIYGPYDLTTPYSRTHRLVTRLIGHSYEEKPELYLEASPMQYLDQSDPPTMILHGTADNLVPISQSDSLKVHLDKLGIPNVYCRVPGWPHTMDLAQRVNDYSRKQMSDFFEKHLK
jgi:acetyl esterase/lipase